MVDFFAQMLDGGGNSPKFYILEDDWNARMFRRIQTPVADLNIVLRNLMPKQEEFAHSVAVAKIWRVYVQSIGVDFFGPLPFATYKKTVEEEPNAPYKSVEDSYTEFFQELKEADELLGSPSPNPIFRTVAYDVIFQNDATKWRKFANSLRLRLALRLSEVDEAKCKSEAAAAIAADVMDNASDNAKLPPIANGGWGNDYNYDMFQNTWGGPLKMTSSIYKLLAGIGGIEFPTGSVNKRAGLNGNVVGLPATHPDKVDPRGPIMFDPPFEASAGTVLAKWEGFPYGVSQDSTRANPDKYKTTLYPELGILIKDGVRQKARPYDLMLYEEVCFLKAEAYARNFVSGDAKAAYEAGVNASFATWGVADKATTYLASNAKNLAGTSANYDDVTGDGNTVLEKIITQKYLALFPDMSMEAWSDKRRLNLPRMDVGLYRDPLLYGSADLDIKKPENFIKRVQYPASETQVNKVEYDKGVQLLGGADRVNTRIWWDKNTNKCTSAN
jgi:hypothetical protein